jgi:hypothetical protein
MLNKPKKYIHQPYIGRKRDGITEVLPLAEVKSAMRSLFFLGKGQSGDTEPRWIRIGFKPNVA